MLSFSTSLSPNSSAFAIFVNEKYDYIDPRRILSKDIVKKIDLFIKKQKTQNHKEEIISLDISDKKKCFIIKIKNKYEKSYFEEIGGFFFSYIKNYKSLSSVDIYADSLIDIVLKTKMQTKLKVKDIGDMFFEFALVTGYADFTYNKKTPSQSKLILKAAKVVPQHTILCGLANLAGHDKPYEMELDTVQKEQTNAATLFYKLSRVTVFALIHTQRARFSQLQN